MKFIISTQELNYLISKIQNLVPPKATIPILSHFLIEAINDELVLTATDLMVGVRCFTEAKILEEGSTTLPAKRLAQLVREITAIDLEISSNESDHTTIVAGSSRFKLHGLNKTEFPSLPDMAGASSFKIAQSALKDMLFRTAFAVSKEDNRYVLTGICLNIANGFATFTGTDGKRLARAYMAIEVDKDLTGTYIIPLKAVDEILKNLSDEGDARIFLLNDKIGVEGTNVIVITKLLSGDYPDVNRVIPDNSNILVSLHRNELISMLRQVSLFTADVNHSVRFNFAEGELSLNANSMDIGEGKVSMAANYHGPHLEIAFNPRFFLDILQHSKEEIITIGLTDGYNPAVITDRENVTAISTNLSPLYVLMPMSPQ